MPSHNGATRFAANSELNIRDKQLTNRDIIVLTVCYRHTADTVPWPFCPILEWPLHER
jgi:hypothetical protein